MTELRWDGKYDANGKKTAPVRIALPFQNIETVNESAEDRKRVLNMFASGKDSEWRNRLIWGDKKYVLPSLLPEFAGKVNLIYIDPPFFTGTDQIISIPISGSESFILKEPSIIEEAAYRNVWRTGSDSFCAWMYDTLLLLRDLLSEDGAIFIRFDQYWSHYVKVIADEVFGKNNFQNDIALKRIYKNFTNQGKISIQLATDSLLLYFVSEKSKFYDIHLQLEETRDGYWRRIDDSAGVRNPPEREIFGKVYYPPAGKHFKFGQARMKELEEQGKIRINSRERPEYWVEPSETKPLTSNWTDISSYSFTTHYPTENSEDLLDRVIRACSKKGDIVLDCFCGSGTTAAVSEKLERKWITCDIGRFSIHTARKRLLAIPNVKPFNVQNLGKYERQQWAQAELGTPLPVLRERGRGEGEGAGKPSPQPSPLSTRERESERAAAEQTYRNFILDLYHGTPLSGYTWLHGAKAGRMIHVGAVDSPVAIGDIKSIVQELWKKVGKTKDITTSGVDVLGWEFAFDINETAKQIAAEHNIDLKTKRIPREVLEKKAVEQGDIKFYELAFLNVKTKVAKKKLSLELKDFIVPPDEIPQDVLAHITHWSQWIDYWAVDWDYKGDTFHNQWQSYRTKKDQSLDLKVEHDYENAGKYSVVVKVIDILGNDTTKEITIEM